MSEVPDRQRDRPCGDEHADDDEADDVDVHVHVLERVPERARELELGRNQAADLDRPDDERDGHRQTGDREVVKDLADRPGERPAVGEVHERAIDRVEQAHPCRKQDREAENGIPRQSRRARAAGDDEQGDLGRGVEAEAEEHPDRVHLRRFRDRPGEPSKEAVHETTTAQRGVERLLVVGAGPHLAKHPHDAHKDREVEGRDDVQEPPETPVPMVLVTACNCELPLFTGPSSARTPTEIRNASAKTIDECPSENQNPTDSGRLPSDISLRVVLSIAAM
jgi:hypothetical protein